MSDPFNPAGPFAPGIAPNLIPNPPGEIPEAVSAGDATSGMSPFSEAIDVDKIIANLVLDRPLKLFIPEAIKRRFSDFEFRIVNSIPTEMADAHNKGFREVTDPEAAALFMDLVAGTDKNGKAFRPVLMGRPKAVGEHVRVQQRTQLRSLYAGMDPKNKDFDSKYAEKVDASAGTKGQFTGAGWNIKLK
jgi:hypothetical protein